MFIDIVYVQTKTGFFKKEKRYYGRYYWSYFILPCTILEMVLKVQQRTMITTVISTYGLPIYHLMIQLSLLITFLSHNRKERSRITFCLALKWIYDEKKNSRTSQRISLHNLLIMAEVTRLCVSLLSCHFHFLTDMLCCQQHLRLSFLSSLSISTYSWNPKKGNADFTVYGFLNRCCLYSNANIIKNKLDPTENNQFLHCKDALTMKLFKC